MFATGLLTASIAQLLRECQQNGTPVLIHLIGGERAPLGRVMAVHEEHAVIAWGEGDGETIWVYFEDILRIEMAPGRRLASQVA